MKTAWPFLIFLALCLIWLGLATRSCAAKRAVAHEVAQAEQQHLAAVTAAAQGAVHDQEAQVQAPTLAADAALVAHLRAQLARARAVPVAPPSAPSTPDPQPVAALPDPVLDGTKDALIDVLTKENGDLKVQVLNLTAARDSWKAAYDDSSKEANLRRITLEAQMAAVRAERWKGRVEGFLAGVGVGYVGGKF